MADQPGLRQPFWRDPFTILKPVELLDIDDGEGGRPAGGLLPKPPLGQSPDEGVASSLEAGPFSRSGAGALSFLASRGGLAVA